MSNYRTIDTSNSMSLQSSSSSSSNLNLKLNQPAPIIKINNNEIIDQTDTNCSITINQSNSSSIPHTDATKTATVNKQSWLLRLFESKLFNIELALIYLYKSKEIGVLNYIGNKLFQFDSDEVDFFLPQLVNLYINHPNICDSIRPYLIHRCKDSLSFSLTLIWLLDSFCFDTKNCHPLMKKKCSGLKLKQQIMSEELWYEKTELNNRSIITVNNKKFNELNCSKLFEMQAISNQISSVIDLKTVQVINNHHLNVKKTHQRSYSETTGVFKSIPIQHVHPSNQSLNNILNQNSKNIGDLNSGRAFDNSCLCLNTRSSVCNELKGERTFKCTCGAPRLLPENEFVKSLINIGKNLQKLSSKDLQAQRLISELQLLNLNLPARVWVPIHKNINHLVLRIPAQSALLLNSKDKTPFLIYIEILKIDCDINLATLPTKTQNLLRQTRSEENLINYYEQQLNGRPLINLSNYKLDSSGVNYTIQKQQPGMMINASEIRNRLTNSIKTSSCNSLNNEELEDSSMVILNETKIKRIRETSPFGNLPNWALISAIVKCNDDLRQEMLAYQLLSTLKKIWQAEMLCLWIRPYKILSLSVDSGLIEPILNTISLSQIKKNMKMTLLEYFIDKFGPQTSEQFMNAQRNFVQSLAGYSVVTYLIQLKDRHNGNILIDNRGHIIHIDFGYILSASPRNLGFENSPFKLTKEMVELLGGVDSDLFSYMKMLILQGLLAARKHSERLINLVEILQSNTQLPCFKLGQSTIKKDRFHMTLTESQLQQQIEQMVQNSVYSLTTKLYDSYQYYSNNIL